MCRATVWQFLTGTDQEGSTPESTVWMQDSLLYMQPDYRPATIAPHLRRGLRVAEGVCPILQAGVHDAFGEVFSCRNRAWRPMYPGVLRDASG